MKITAAVIPARNAPFEMMDLDLAPPQPDEVLVRMHASGMCHTDLHARDGYFPGLNYPCVCGHEGAGVIEDVGSDVTDLKLGDPVVISYPWCGNCEPCRLGHPAYCLEGRTLKSSGARADGSTPMSKDGKPVYSCFFQQSSFGSFAVTPARNVVKVRADAPLEMLGPLCCGVQTGAGAVFNVAQPKPGQAVAIFGVGGVGLAALMAAKLCGCDPIIAVDIIPSRLKLARELGATHTLDGKAPDLLAAIGKITGGGVHFSFECTAVPQIFRICVDSLRPLGACILLGSARFGTEAALDMPVIQYGRIVRGVVQGDSKPREFIPRMVDLFMEGKLPIDRLITTYKFSDINQAAEDAMRGTTIKPVLRIAA